MTRGSLLTGLSVCTLFGTGAVSGAPLTAGTIFGLDIGNSGGATNIVGNDWNDISSNVTGLSVHDLNTVAIDGVTVSHAGGAGFNTDGVDNFVGLQTNGGALPAPFVDSVTTDITFSLSNNITVTIDGLDDNLRYNIDATVTSRPNFGGLERLTINGGPTSLVNRAGSRTDGSFHSFDNLASSGGTLSLVFTQDGGNNPIVSGILIEAVPSPTAALAGLIGLGGLCARRRRR